MSATYLLTPHFADRWAGPGAAAQPRFGLSLDERESWRLQVFVSSGSPTIVWGGGKCPECYHHQTFKDSEIVRKYCTKMFQCFWRAVECCMRLYNVQVGQGQLLGAAVWRSGPCMATEPSVTVGNIHFTVFWNITPLSIGQGSGCTPLPATQVMCVF